MQRYFAVIIFLVITASCTMPETKIYSLSLQIDTKTGNMKADKALDITIQAPRYLSQPYIARRVSAYQLKLSRYAKWDSAPADMVKEAVRDSLFSVFKETRGSGASANVYSLLVNLKRFEQVDSGADSFGELTMDFSLLSEEGKEVYHGSISKSVKLDEHSEIGLAKGLSTALTEAMKELKAGISALAI